MCFCDLVHKTGIRRLGQGMEGSLHFLASLILSLSILRMLIHLAFGI